jgi:D-alanine-D-alanine ligase
MSRVLLLFGGRSAEHEVSCSSAAAVHDALADAGHRVIPVGIDRDGRWFLADPTSRPLRAAGRDVSLRVPDGHLFVGSDDIGFDVVFPVLHGPGGEDGAIQGLVESCGLPYVGCGIAASAVAMDKDLAKRLVADQGIRTSRWETVRHAEWNAGPSVVVESVLRTLRLPVFVKPVGLGSSVGIARVAERDALKDAMANAFRFDDAVLVEQEVTGREIEVAVLDGPRASDPGEVVVESGWYTYDAKYADESSRFEAPAQLPATDNSTVRGLAERIFVTLGLEGLARIDFFYDGSGRFWFNEANTMPGFTSISGFPQMWLATGLTYAELCNGLVEAAMERHARRSSRSMRSV